LNNIQSGHAAYKPQVKSRAHGSRHNNRVSITEPQQLHAS